MKTLKPQKPLPLVKPLSNAKAIRQLVLADKQGRDHGDRVGKQMVREGWNLSAEALLTDIRTAGVQRFDRLPVE